MGRAVYQPLVGEFWGDRDSAFAKALYLLHFKIVCSTPYYLYAKTLLFNTIETTAKNINKVLLNQKAARLCALFKH